MNPDEWEAVCKKCGKCCYEKVDLGGGIIRYTDEPCVHLDTETNLCNVYENRREAQPDCISLTEHLVRTLTWLPEDCAYLEYVRHNDTLAAVREVNKRRKRTRNAQRRR
ncbi:MAG: YkgJ family cysteine cluster protein [Desulfomonilaceae bacterium]|nr:YkgJ family cysteine cluster protein [Desulfomonilaceae bacterium]